MLYFLDCEFNGFGGDLISLALSGEVGELYLVRPEDELNALTGHDWVADHVLPRLSLPDARPQVMPRARFGQAIQAFLSASRAPTIVADWPEDLMHLMQCLIIAPGQMVRIPDLSLQLVHPSSFPAELDRAVQHNALWDARALRRAVQAVQRT